MDFHTFIDSFGIPELAGLGEGHEVILVRLWLYIKVRLALMKDVFFRSEGAFLEMCRVLRGRLWVLGVLWVLRVPEVPRYSLRSFRGRGPLSGLHDLGRLGSIGVP
jgi:hypothetical protein